MENKQDTYSDDRFKLMLYRKVSLALIALGTVLAISLAVKGTPFISLPFLLAAILLVAGLPFAYAADKIEEKHDLETTSEVEAFMKGTEPDYIERDREGSKVSRRFLRTLPAVGFAAAFLAAVLVVALAVI